MTRKMQLMCLALILYTVHMTHAAYKIGVGRADCTGPSAEITFMGYAKAGQKGCGIHLRQYSRAYIIEDNTKRVAFVTVDACMMNHGVRKSVLAELKKLYGDMYTVDNLILSGTHTHSTPGGFLMDVMLDVPNLGFLQETFDALVSGIVRSMKRAHENIVEAKIYIDSGTIPDASINRSPAAYLFNPKEETAKYDSDTDKEIVQLKFVQTSNNQTIGAINWFAVHPTSMNNTNCLVTSDNVGYASILLEASMDEDALPGQSKFVGAFASTNLGDVTPNTKGPRCINTGEKCDGPTSTCDGQAKFCIASGPGNDMFESTEIIAKKMYNKAKELLTSTKSTEVTGEIKYIHQFVHMPNQTVTVQLENGTTTKVKGCLPAMGYSFAAGTIDGPGEFNFTQATNTTNPFWNTVRDFIFPPSPSDVSCHAPKPILIMTGSVECVNKPFTTLTHFTPKIGYRRHGKPWQMPTRSNVSESCVCKTYGRARPTLALARVRLGSGTFDTHQRDLILGNRLGSRIHDIYLFGPSHPRELEIHLPYQWQAQVVSTQLVMIGNVVLAAVPGEFTTMSGRRLRDAIRKEIIDKDGLETKVIITGLSNVYTSYIATYEEYQLQRYEGASTIFGPHTLSIYLEKYKELATALIKGTSLGPGPSPYVFPHNLLSLVPPVLFDTCGWFNNFGDCIQQPPSTVGKGETVIVKFLAGHPRNNLLQEDTFLKVEKLEDGKWKIIATDSSWETKFIWRRRDYIKGSSEAEIQWKINDKVEPGTYRIRHFGYYKYILGGIYPYEGQTKSFTVTS